VNLPTEAEIIKSLGEQKFSGDVPSTIDSATRAAEILTLSDFRERTIREKLMIGHMNTVLKHHPVHNVYVENHRIYGDENNAIFYLDVPPSNYTVTYQVGFKRGDVPAIVYEAIANLARLKLTGDDTYRISALAELGIIRTNRLKAIEGRLK
jgi:hypothetical protein